MTDTPDDNTTAAAREALEFLRLALMDDEITDAARVTAARTLLDRFIPKDDADIRQRESEERAAALAEARRLLAEFALAKLAGFSQPPALAACGAAEPDNATGPGAE